MLGALEDPDERVLGAALNAAVEGCSFPAAMRIMRCLQDRALDARAAVLGVRAVAAHRTDEVLHWLLGMVLVETRLLRRTRLAPSSPEMLVALGALAAHWRNDPRAAEALALAGRSDDADVRVAITHGARRLSSSTLRAIEKDVR